MTNRYGHLRKAQLNDLYARILSADFSHDDFAWWPRIWDIPGGDQKTYPSLFLKADPKMSFTFGFSATDPTDDYRYHSLDTTDSGKHSYWCIPGTEDPDRIGWLMTWNALAFDFGTWLDVVKEEHSLLNPWEMSEGARHALLAPPNEGQQTFASSDLSVINGRFDVLLSEVKAIGVLQSAQLEGFQQFVAESKDAACRLTKKDWKAAVIGWAVGFAINHGLAPEVTQQVLQLLGATFTVIFAHGPALRP